MWVSVIVGTIAMFLAGLGLLLRYDALPADEAAAEISRVAALIAIVVAPVALVVVIVGVGMLSGLAWSFHPTLPIPQHQTWTGPLPGAGIRNWSQSP